MTKISVILTTYNIEKYVKESIKSLIAQEFDDYEIIVVDDESNDNTYKIVQKYAQKFDFIKAYQIEHSLVGEARNFGFKQSRGKYVIFLDGDDVFDSCMLYKMYQKMENENSDVAICGSLEFVDNLRNIKKYHSILDKYPIGWASDKLVKRKLIEKYDLKFSDFYSSEDLVFGYGSYFLASKVSRVNENLLFRRIRKESVSNNRDTKNAFVALLELKEKLIQAQKFDKLKNDFQNIALNFLFWHFKSIGKIEFKKEIWEYMRFFENELDILRMKDVEFEKAYKFYSCAIKSKDFNSFIFKYYIRKIFRLGY